MAVPNQYWTVQWDTSSGVSQKTLKADSKFAAKKQAKFKFQLLPTIILTIRPATPQERKDFINAN